MNLTCRHLPGATLITVAGQVDTTSSARLEDYIHQHHRKLSDDLVFDVSRMAFLDSSGLAVLLATATLARGHGAGVHLAGLQATPARLLNVTGARQAVTVHEHLDQAVAAAIAAAGSARPDTTS
ncbi:STAS domain-containing protein [Nonomuraea terrae]|uniref:STAS domain-containing protein n=1 Tax=Nonomuraea terrae TaxID=2530383 RepID=UPI0037B948E6